ncbi:MAG: homoserine kinase [Clostridiales bacterium]|nr:homoserine kinase [Clostridiales bacterium]
MLKIKAPCSSANVGPGFDCLGIAFNIYNEFCFEPSDKTQYVGFAERHCNDNNMVYQAYKTTMESLAKPVLPLKISFNGKVPNARGLGSSSTCIVAGVAAAYEFAGMQYTKNDVAYMSALIEGHPDNVTPCVYGGFTNSVMVADGEKEILLAENFSVHESFNFYALIPDFALSTKQSRDVLPKSFSLTTAKKNIANVTLLVRAFERGDGRLLSFASEDWLHQPYRCGVIPGFFDIQSKAMQAGANAVFLSGAGPTMLVVSQNEIKDQLNEVVAGQQANWQVKQMKIDYNGLVVIKD